MTLSVVDSVAFSSVFSVCSAASDAEFAMLLSPCWASVAPSASGSPWVTPSLAHLLCRGRNVDLENAVRDADAVRDVIERYCDWTECDVDVEGEEESTRSAARRKQSLPQRLSVDG